MTDIFRGATGAPLGGAVLALLVVSGCLSSVPKDADPRHLEIHWAKDYEEARLRAKAESRPILLIGAAGDIVGEC